MTSLDPIVPLKVPPVSKMCRNESRDLLITISVNPCYPSSQSIDANYESVYKIFVLIFVFFCFFNTLIWSCCENIKTKFTSCLSLSLSNSFSFLGEKSSFTFLLEPNFLLNLLHYLKPKSWKMQILKLDSKTLNFKGFVYL